VSAYRDTEIPAANLIQKQIDTVGLGTFGGATDVERREYEERRKRIDELQTNSSASTPPRNYFATNHLQEKGRTL